MSVQTVKVLIPPRRPAPASAARLGAAGAWLFGPADSGSPSLLRSLRLLREQLAREREARRDARARNELLNLARSYASTQPEFAKDLVAAASNDRGR